MNQSQRRLRCICHCCSRAGFSGPNACHHAWPFPFTQARVLILNPELCHGGRKMKQLNVSHWLEITMTRQFRPGVSRCHMGNPQNSSKRFVYFNRPTRSIHAMTRDEIRRGIANRAIHSRTYIILYLVMAALSITTVVLSIREGCPGLAFYILEVIINSAMIAEVAIRFLAFGRVSETVLANQDPQLIYEAWAAILETPFERI